MLSVKDGSKTCNPPVLDPNEQKYGTREYAGKKVDKQTDVIIITGMSFYTCSWYTRIVCLFADVLLSIP